MRQREYHYARALVKRAFCLLEREKLIRLFEARCGREGPPWTVR
jgi:hypothetical protein